MRRKKRKSITVGKSEFPCKNCGGEMVIRKHGEGENEKLRRQVYFFKQWDYCQPCNKVFFNEEFKVTTGRGSDWEEIQRQTSFLKSITR